MIGEKSTGGLDSGALRDAIERRDPDALLGFCAEDSELRTVNAALPEGDAFELRGRSQIERCLRAVCEQRMTCLLEGGVVFGQGSIEFREVCEYPDESRILVGTEL